MKKMSCHISSTLMYFVIGCILTSIAYAQPAHLPVVSPTQTPRGITLDGVLNATEWQGAAKIDLKQNLTGKPMENPTEAFLMYDEQNLYVGFMCHEKEMDKVVSYMTTENGAVYLDDCIEVMINPAEATSERSYVHFAANIAGIRYTENRRIQGRVADWKVKTARQGESWTAELVIPLNYLVDENVNVAYWRINLFRERKAGKEEYYSWSTTRRFHDSQNFGVLKGININGKFIGLKAPVMPAKGSGKPGTQNLDVAQMEKESPMLIIPKPVQFIPTRQDFIFNPQTRIVIPMNPTKGHLQAATEINEELVEELGLVPLPIVNAADVSDYQGCIVLGEFDNAGKKAPLEQAKPGPEGYVLWVGKKEIIINGTDEAGTYYGVQSLKQLLRRVDNGVIVKGAWIWDQPAFPVRSVHVLLDNGSPVIHKKMIKKFFSRFKYNQIVMEAEHGIRWQSRPEVQKAYGMSPEEARELAQYAKDHYLEVVPLIQSLGHGDWMFGGINGKANLEFAEDPQSHYAYCPLDPRSYDFIFSIFDEAIDIFQPRTIHIGHDEIDMRGTFPNHEYCKAVGKYDLYFADTLMIYNHLKSRGIKTMLWGDLFPKQGYKDNLPSLPKDILIADWIYGDQIEYPTTKMYMDKGFETIGCTWYIPANISRFSEYAYGNKAKGMMQTTWAGYNQNTSIVERAPEQVAAYITAADWFWNPVNRDVNNPGYDPFKVMKGLWYGHPKVLPKKGFTVNLSPYANLSLVDPGLTGFMKIGKGQDFSSLVSQAQKDVIHLEDNIQYRLSKVKEVPCGIALKGFGLMESFPSVVENIQINRKAFGLNFLHTTLYSMETGKLCGEYLITYTDNTQVKVPLIYGKNIGGWQDMSSYYSGNWSWFGMTANKRPVWLLQSRWINPYPDKTIRSMSMVNSPVNVSLVLMGITGLE